MAGDTLGATVKKGVLGKETASRGPAALSASAWEMVGIAEFPEGLGDSRIYYIDACLVRLETHCDFTRKF